MSGIVDMAAGSISPLEMQSYEAIRWALDRLNKKNEELNGEYLNNSYIPGVELGMMVKNYCDMGSTAVSYAQDLYPQFLSESRDCTKSSNRLMLGLTGASSSSDTKEVNAFTSQFDIPLVSYMSTAQELTNGNMYPAFMRTVSPDGPLMDAVIKVMGELNWKYVVVVYTENTYGRGSLEEIRPRLAEAGICLTLAVPADPSDTTPAAMAAILDRVLATETVGVIYLGGSSVGLSLLEQGESHANAGKLQWIYTDSLPLSTNFGGKKYPRGVIAVLSGSRKIIEFEDHWVRIDVSNPSSENPWFQDWYMNENNCQLPGNTNPAFSSLPQCTPLTESDRRNSFVQDQFVEPAVHAVYAYAHALKTAHAALCGGSAGLCPQLASLSQEDFYDNYLRSVNFTYTKKERVESLASVGLEPYNAPAQLAFDANGDIIKPTYDIYNFNDYPGGAIFKFRKLGSYLNGRLEIVTSRMRMYDEARDNALASLPASLCPGSGCGPCLGLLVDADYLYIPGDIVINGIFSVHEEGKNALSCGNFNNDIQSGVQFLEGMVYALSNINNQPAQALLQGVSLGALGFDDCMDKILGSHFVTQVQTETRMITDTNGNTLDPRSVEAYMGADGTDLTMPLAKLMNIIKRPLLGYNAMSAELHDNDYYLYMSYSNRLYMKAFVLLLKRLGWQYVQTVRAKTMEAKNAIEEFRMIAAEHGICVVSAYEFGTDGDVEDILMMLEGQSSVNPVLVVSPSEDLLELLQEVQKQNKTGNFVFMAPVVRSENVFQGAEAAAEGLISLDVQRPDMSAFQGYLSRLRTDSYTTNPWFGEWFENMHECSLDANDMRDYTTVCSVSDVTSGKNFKLNVNSYATIYGVYAIAYGLHYTLQYYCGIGYSGVCGNYMTAADKGEKLVEMIKQMSFTVDGLTIQFEDGQANFPLEFSNYRSGFSPVGTYNAKTNSFVIQTSQISLAGGVLLNSVMPYCKTVCTQCLYMFGTQEYMYIDGDLIIPGIFDVHYPGMTDFLCGSIRSKNGFLNTEAFAFALQQVNSGFTSVKLNNVKLGGLLFDGCMNTIRGHVIASSVYYGLMPRENGMPKYPIDRLLGWLSYDSATTVNIAESLGHFGVPVVTPGATTPVLDNKSRFDKFFRTIPSDGVTTLAMAQVAKEMGFEYIITLNAPEEGSRDAVDKFREYARDNGICIGASYEFVTDGPMDTLIQYITESSSRVVAVFSDPDRFVEDLLIAKNNNPQAGNIVFMANRPWENPFITTTSLFYATNSLTFGFKFPPLPEFRNYLSQKYPITYTDNPWFSEFYQKYFLCNLDGNWMYGQNCGTSSIVTNDFIEDYATLPTIHAVYAMAEGVHRTLMEKCGSSYSGVCSRFLTDTNTFTSVMLHMDALNFTDILGDIFHFVKRESNMGVTIDRIEAGTSLLEGTFGNGAGLSLQDRNDLASKYTGTPATCIGDCAQCYILGDGSEKFTFYSGNIMFVGLFDIHKKGQTPYSCGEINDEHGFQLLEAFHFALEYANNRSGIFRNVWPEVTFGGVALDVCQNPTRAGNMIANIHSGTLKLTTKSQSQDITINPDNIDVYVGPFDSESTIRVADIVNPLGIPQISYAATSLELMDPYKYRYFLRTVPADDKQARAIISYLKRFDLNNVQVITSYDSIGLHGLEEFARLARLNRICISQNITTGVSGSISIVEAQTTLNKLFSYRDATVVIMFVEDPETLLQSIENRDDVRNNFTFIGTDKLGFNHEQWNNARKLMNSRRAVTFDIETADVPELDKYLEYKTPENYFFNPWFDEYYQELFQCNFDSRSTKYSEPCPTHLLGIPRAEKYIQDPYALYVINAVFSAVFGVDKALREICPSNTIGVCNLFRTSGERRQRIMTGIQATSFVDATNQPFYYEEGGDSSRGYHIWEPLPSAEDNTQYYLEDVGAYNDTHYLKIDARYDVNWHSTCDRPGSCTCEFPEYQPSRYMKNDTDWGLYIAYVSDIHDRDPYNPYACGQIDTVGDFQNMMAFFYALNLVNSDTNLPATLKLGGIAFDTCSSSNRIGQDIYSLLSGEGICTENTGQVIPPSNLVAYIAKGSENAIRVSGILSPLKYTTLSQSATSVALSNKDFHEYFLRTVPPDNVQAIVIAKVLQTFGWDYVSAVYTDDAYGNAAIKTLISNTENSSPRICASQTISMPLDATLDDAKAIIDSLNQRVGARVVVLFVSDVHARLLLQATTERGLTHRFIWLGSDTWANSEYIVSGYEDAAAGAITIQIRSEVVEGFKNFLRSFDYSNRMNMPRDWFEDLYQTLHQCRILNSVVQKVYSSICSGDEQITDAMIPNDPYTLHTIISVFMVANGLNSIEECKRTSLSLSACLSLQQNSRDLIYNNIAEAQYTVLPDDLGSKSFNFRYTEDGYGDVGYNILNFRRDLTSGEYAYAEIGTYRNGLSLNRGLYQGFSFIESRTIPLSMCPVGSNCPCLNSDGSRSSYKRQGVAGLTFYRLDDGSYVDAQTGEVIQVEDVPQLADRFADIWGIIVATLAAIGMFASLCMFVYLLVMYPVRGGTSILGFMLSFGNILLFALVFAFIVHATREVCGLRRFCLGFCYSICYSALFVKIVDSWRSRSKEELYEVKYRKLGRPLGLFFCALLFILVQVIINTEWLILEPPAVTTVLYNNMLWPRCTPDDFYDEGLVLSLVYIMFLVILCVLYGMCAWPNPKNHHEARWLLGIVLLGIPVWVVFCVLAVLGEYKMRDAAIAIGLLINAYIMLLLGPMRKLYLLTKFEEQVEEEERKSALGSVKGEYSSMYGRQYDNTPRLHEPQDSARNSVLGGDPYVIQPNSR
ncbi:LOW QUALITY PROTEIN: uncharacterized protein LOC117333478 [Pecten maximus]|uniref:LOW QUALITY PROTEIN: uncharacterized protein LOC117333478 n=1 Tax=Pecten maximus TaxID=6579 RepID=UPI00145826EA|nr:LOW QUALITY PROTEIN: uncharacterized protein LOC117333478 [Pecten maximus]